MTTSQTALVRYDFLELNNHCLVNLLLQYKSKGNFKILFFGAKSHKTNVERTKVGLERQVKTKHH